MALLGLVVAGGLAAPLPMPEAGTADLSPDGSKVVYFRYTSLADPSPEIVVYELGEGVLVETLFTGISRGTDVTQGWHCGSTKQRTSEKEQESPGG